MASGGRLSGSGPEPFEACPDDGRCWHSCPGAVEDGAKGLPCWRVLHAAPFGDGPWPPDVRAAHREAAGEDPVLDADAYPASYKARMLASYPVIAGLTADQAWAAGQEEREVAFGRILRARNLRRTHELYLEWRRARGA